MSMIAAEEIEQTQETQLSGMDMLAIYSALDMLGKYQEAEKDGRLVVFQTREEAKRALEAKQNSYWESYSCSRYMGTDDGGEPKWRDGKFYVCHNYRCRRKTVVKSHYCPNCGAKMDGGDAT